MNVGWWICTLFAVLTLIQKQSITVFGGKLRKRAKGHRLWPLSNIFDPKHDGDIIDIVASADVAPSFLAHTRNERVIEMVQTWREVEKNRML